jgi:solute carrier family 35, member F1/2
MDTQTRITAFLRSQFLSLCNTSTGIIASVLSHNNPPANFPVFLSLLNYILLMMYYFRPNIKKIQGILESMITAPSSDLSSPTDLEQHTNTHYYPHLYIMHIFKKLVALRYPLYFIAALIDVQASVIVLTSFQYTSVISVVLLDSCAIPCTMLLSYIFLGAEYRISHLIGTLICIIGLGCNVFSDYYYSSSEETVMENALYGDLMCLLAYFLYSIGNVMQEYLVKYVDRGEYLGMLGFWGTMIALVQCLSTEYYALNILRSASMYLISLICGYVGILFLFYVNASIIIQFNDATYFNLSLLTSDIYALIFAYFVFHTAVHWLYFLSFALVVIGLIIYHSISPPTGHDPVSIVDDDEDLSGKRQHVGSSNEKGLYEEVKTSSVDTDDAPCSLV